MAVTQRMMDDAAKVDEELTARHTAEVEAALSEARQRVGTEPLATLVDGLHALEKRLRLAADIVPLGELLGGIAHLCLEAGDHALLLQVLTLCSKRRGQSTAALVRMVRTAIGALPGIGVESERLHLIRGLTQVCEGKIFLEVEHALLARVLARVLARQGKLSEAADVLLALHVETNTKLPVLHKVALLLEQLQLCLGTGDLVRALVVIRKIPSRRVFAQPHDLPLATQQLAARYYQLLVKYHASRAHYLEMSDTYHELLKLPVVQGATELRTCALDHAILYALLAPRTPAQQAVLHALGKRTDLHLASPEAVQLRALLASGNIVSWADVSERLERLATRPVRALRTFTLPDAPSEATEELSYFRRPEYATLGAQRTGHLRRRVASHNIGVLARSYTSITYDAACALLDIDADTLEELLAIEVVEAKRVYARMDRPARLITFCRPETAADAMQAWNTNFAELFELVDATTHRIKRLEAVQAGAPQRV